MFHLNNSASTRGWLVALAALSLAAAAEAQAPAGKDETVSWQAAVAGPAKPGGRATVQLSAAVTKGWHLYGLKQLPEGPTPLVVSLEPGSVATAGGAPTGSPPIKAHDPSFDLDTQYYAQDFTVAVPVRISATASGPQTIALNVRYQTCNGAICHLPKTVRLTAALDVQAGR